MHKTILIMLLAVVSSSAMAEWVVIGTDEKTTYYVYSSSIRKSGNKVKMWVLFDYRMVRNDNPYILSKSAKSQQEYDCKEEKSRVLFYSHYTENMGQGDSRTVEKRILPADWDPIMPESMGESFWKYACGK